MSFPITSSVAGRSPRSHLLYEKVTGVSMSSVIKTPILRHARLPSSACRGVAIQPPTVTRLTAFHNSAITRKSPSLRVKALQPSRRHTICPSSIRVAAFHASGRRLILPGEPREYFPQLSMLAKGLIGRAEVIDGTGLHMQFMLDYWNLQTHGLAANDPAPVPTPSPTHGSYHWAFERYEWS